ncbi:DHA2 family efflux MFS transporter permease subunit [Alsobacter sp. KACC 23698]|uniref:DHA2 family efflux MFS transporter permease subunit n=1 Tax=Alsobacter sp. KACC 23698 TaxID=3149229 RepID=A0AAU7JMC2_9HYPH
MPNAVAPTSRFPLPPERLVPLIVATALFMENLDSTVLATSLPAIATDLGANPIHLKLALTSYLLALAIFIPASGWLADRFGARVIFRLAMVVFAAGSVACGFSTDIGTLVAARVIQGMGGAMMVPVGRLVVLRTIDRSQIVDALAWLTIPALLGPILGPPVGGFITTYFNWRWIFWINIPIAALGVVLATIHIPDIREDARTKFDTLGFLLVGPGLAAFLTGATLAGLDLLPSSAVAGLVAGGALLLALYVRHALRAESPIIDLRLLSLPTFRASLTGGFLFRVGVGATPFLLPLLLQAGFGYDAFRSGLTTFAAGVGSLVMKIVASPILRRFGFRRVLVVNAVLSSVLVAAPAGFGASTPVLLMLAVLVTGGFLRSLQFTSINAVAYADMPASKLSRATTFAAVLQELSGSIGVSIAALGLEAVSRVAGGDVLSPSHFAWVFGLIGLISMSSAVIFWRSLPLGAGASLVARPVSGGAPLAAKMGPADKP